MLDKKVYMKKWKEENKESVRQYNLEYKRNNKAVLKVYQAEVKDRRNYLRRKQYDPLKQKSIRLYQAYGISLAQYNSLLEAQDRKCAICKTSAEDAPRGLQVDHDHRTEEIRGLLCVSCNTAIGSFRDDVVRMSSAINYLSAKRVLPFTMPILEKR